MSTSKSKHVYYKPHTYVLACRNSTSTNLSPRHRDECTPQGCLQTSLRQPLKAHSAVTSLNYTPQDASIQSVTSELHIWNDDLLTNARQRGWIFEQELVAGSLGHGCQELNGVANKLKQVELLNVTKEEVKR